MQNLFQRNWWKENRLTVGYSIFIMLAGTLLHFVYEWSGENSFLAMFSAINESVWEHLKIFFIPAFFFTVACWCWKGEDSPNYLWCQTKSILVGMLFIVVVFFTYTGIAKRDCSVIDIGSFYVAAILSGVISGRCQENSHGRAKQLKKYAGVILLILWALFVWFSYCLPETLIDYLPGLFKEY